MNLSGSGLGWTLGPRGASIGIGKRGTYLNSGIPGTGLTYRQALTGSSSASNRVGGGGRDFSRVAAPTPAIKTVSLTVSVSDDGGISFKDSDGNPVSEGLIETAKQQQGEAIKAMIQKTCDDINAQVEALGELHLHTPPPNRSPTYQAQSFDEPRPVPPVPAVPSFFEKLFRGKVSKIKAANDRALDNYEADLSNWRAARGKFKTTEAQKQSLISKAVAGDAEAMEEFFGEVLMDIVWPRETLVSFEVQDGGKRLAFDIDLPEREDMPSKTASVPQRGFKLSVKDIGPINIQKMYAKHIHSIGFRLIGEAFGMLPTVQAVTLSGYSQRKNKATGQVRDEYLLSVIVPRTRWIGINFESLDSIDVMEAFTRFELKREMSKSGVFAAIEPF